MRVEGAVTAALVIGGGPAGSALAARLASAGRPVVLVEREAGPHDKVCGEFISWEAAALLAELGVDPAVLGAAPIDTVGLSHRARSSHAPLPAEAWSLSRRTLDEALLRRAAESGAEIRRGVRVSALAREPGGWRATLDDGEALFGGQAFLATGKHDLRGWRRPEGPQGDLIGFKMHWRLAPGAAQALRGRVELYLFPGGYAGLEPVEDGRANLCLLVKQVRYAALGGWPALLEHLLRSSPGLKGRLAGAEPAWERPLAVAAIPYGYVAAPRDDLWRLGDQAAVIPSFAGDGMAIALHSARAAADAFLAGETARAFQHRLHRQLAGQVGVATAISRLLVTPWGQAAASGLARLAPPLLPLAARATRIPSRALGATSSSRPIAVASPSAG